MERLRVLLCDDQPEMLTLLKGILEPQYCVIGMTENGQGLLEAARALRPEIVLIDINMPGTSGLEAARTLREKLPDCRIIFHSSHDEPEIMAAAFAAGASGYLIKGSPGTLTTSLRTVIDSVWTQTVSLVTTQDSRQECWEHPPY